MLVLGVIIALALIFIVVKIIKSCLPKVIIGLIIIGVLAYLAYRYLF